MIMRRFITLHTHNCNEEVVLELPGDQSLQSIIPNLLKTLNWPETSGGNSLNYSLKTESGVVLNPSQSLAAAEIEDFDDLWITLENELSEDNMDRAERIPGQESRLISSTEEDTGVLPSPVAPELPIDQPCLVSEAGLVFILGEGALIIGRRSHEGTPQIDLTELDSDLICSRRHAEIVCMNGLHILRAFNTRNGMLVNGTLYRPGEPVALNDRDELQFGQNGVKRIYRK